MTWWQWLAVIWAAGIPFAGIINVGLIRANGGRVLYLPGIIRNAIFWPIYLPAVIVMFIISG